MTATTVPLVDATGISRPMNAEQGALGYTLHSVPEVAGAAVGTANPMPVASTPTATAPGLATVSSAALETAHVIKAAPGNLYSFSVTATSVGGFVQIFDAIAVPADGAVLPRKVYALPAGVSVGDGWAIPLAFVNGIVIVFSAAATPFTKTTSATAFISAEVA